jgi:AraC-like DNA-binding protein
LTQPSFHAKIGSNQSKEVDIMRKNEVLQKLYFSALSQNENFTCRWSFASDYHQHKDFYEISLVTQGTSPHFYEGKAENIESGTLLFYDMGTIHQIGGHSSESMHFTLCLSKAYFHILAQLFHVDISFLNEKKFLKCKLAETTFQYMFMLANTITSEPTDSLFCKLFFYNAFSLLMIQETKPLLTQESDYIDDIIKNINNYSYLTLSIQDIYKHYPYSVPTIIKKFKERTGTTVIRYQTNVRLDCAAQQLRETNHSIEYIITQLDFQSTGHFYNIFKKRYGMTPQAYRQLAKEHPDSKLLFPSNIVNQ